MMFGNLDFIIAFEFKSDGKKSIAHLLFSDKSKFLNDIFLHVVSQFSLGLEIKVH